MLDQVKRNVYGYYELTVKPDQNKLKEYYKEKYYQENRSAYKEIYTELDMLQINNQLEKNYFLLKSYLPIRQGMNFLDIGCGEGWALNFFKKKGFNILGLDYSSEGINKHNPDLLDYFICGDIFDNLDNITNHKQKYDIIWLDNVLEHVLDPELLLKQIYSILEENGVIVIEVPNDFSIVQIDLYNKGYVKEPYWVAIPDHISYFNKEGLAKLCNSVGFSVKDSFASLPIDLFIYNESTNYIKKPNLGSECYKSIVEIEDLLLRESPQKLIELSKLLLEIGIGRSITCFCLK